MTHAARKRSEIIRRFGRRKRSTVSRTFAFGTKIFTIAKSYSEKRCAGESEEKVVSCFARLRVRARARA